MTALDEALRRLGPTDLPPTVEDLGGVDALRDAVTELHSNVLPRLVEVVACWSDAPEHPQLTEAIVSRLPDIEAPLDFASSMDRLLPLVVTTENSEIARSLMTKLLAVVHQAAESEMHALRAGYAIRAAVDLSLLDAGVSTHGVLAVLENLPDVRPELAPGVARAAGRLWEHHDEAFLRRVLEERVLPHQEAAGDGLLELGLDRLREAFYAGDRAATLEALGGAQQLFEHARSHDEERPDARAFAAACRAVVAFAEEKEAIAAALDDLADARIELERYATDDLTGFRGATPLRSVADWHVLSATLRALGQHLERPDFLHLRPAIEALSEAYTGMRLGVLEDQERGFIAFIQPLVRDRVEASGALSEAVVQYAEEADSPVGARELAGEVVRPKAFRRQAMPPERR